MIATMNLNGDYISDALAACVGGIGIAPGGNINYDTGHAIFEATHGTAPKYADQDKVNPGSVILSGEMMFRHLGWTEAADLIIKGVNGAIAAKTVTYDFARQMEGASRSSARRSATRSSSTWTTDGGFGVRERIDRWTSLPASVSPSRSSRSRSVRSCWCAARSRSRGVSACRASSSG